ncbi:MAG: glycine hydroxymethyltransferase [Myxococcota bacterium]|jgi:glycine hydroxymethyltransferase
MDALRQTDVEIHDLIVAEEKRQRDVVRLIPSENYVSRAVLDATGSVLTNKYSEGYAGKRYYEGQEVIDVLESLTIERAKALFGAEHANVQPYSGSPANLAVYTALLKTGDKLMGMSLPHGGHLTHGWKVSVTGKNYEAVQYTVREEDGRLDYDAIREQAKRERPKILVAGATAYPREIDFEAFASIAREIDAYFLADIAHIAGLIAAGVHPSPVPHADVVSTTTHKTLRGPRGGMILCRKKHRKAIDRAVFPGLQGGPHNHTTAGLAVALKEANTPEFVAYAKQVVINAKAMAARLSEHGFNLVTGGTDNHLILFDATSRGSTGKELASAMARAGLVANANTVPFDKRTPFDPSGVRLGTPAVTSRGMGTTEMVKIADWIAAALEAQDKPDALDAIAKDVTDMCRQFTAPGLEHLS